jgi:hypothetical protein
MAEDELLRRLERPLLLVDVVEAFSFFGVGDLWSVVLTAACLYSFYRTELYTGSCNVLYVTYRIELEQPCQTGSDGTVLIVLVVLSRHALAVRPMADAWVRWSVKCQLSGPDGSDSESEKLRLRVARPAVSCQCQCPRPLQLEVFRLAAA